MGVLRNKQFQKLHTLTTSELAVHDAGDKIRRICNRIHFKLLSWSSVRLPAFEYKEFKS